MTQDSIRSGRNYLYYCDGANSSFIGLDIYQLLEQNKTLEECKQQLRQVIKEKFDIEVPTSQIVFRFGEWGDG